MRTLLHRLCVPLSLSLKYKIPLWATVLIITSSLSVTASLMVQAYRDLRSDLEASSSGLGYTLARTLFPAILNDNIWDAFEIVRAPLRRESRGNFIIPEVIIALDRQQHVIVSSHPKVAPMLTDIRLLGEAYSQLGHALETAGDAVNDPLVVETQDHLFVTVPVARQGARLGTVVLLYSQDELAQRFRAVAWQGLSIGLLVIALLLPVHWYWGWRMARPLVTLAHGMGDVAQGVLKDLPPTGYRFQDEVGKLFATYRWMVAAMREKVALEQEVIKTERLAAIGRLAAGMAHEINNPLAGMLVVIDNVKRKGEHDRHMTKTLSTIERGLTQIRDTVAAILVDAKVKGRDLTPQDIEDVKLLLAGEARKRSIRLKIKCEMTASVALPANPVRQILLNLLLNAIAASDSPGEVTCKIQLIPGSIMIDAVNVGRTIPPPILDRLFEPFSQQGERGASLGLWVTYQVVSQLGGNISAESCDGVTCFRVTVPTGDGND